MLATHNAGNVVHACIVGNDGHIGCQCEVLAVERSDSLPILGAAGDDGVMGPLGPGFGGAEGPVPHRFRVLFGRSAKALKEWVAAKEKAGPPTQSDLSRAGYDAGREPWLAAADYTWDEGLLHDAKEEEEE